MRNKYESPGFYNADCMEAMKEFPDNFFDLAIVDPPYGNANSEFAGREKSDPRFDKYKKVERTGGTWASKYEKKIAEWDIAPEKEYFDELFRVSRNQIIWGGQLLPASTDEMFYCLAETKHKRII